MKTLVATVMVGAAFLFTAAAAAEAPAEHKYDALFIELEKAEAIVEGAVQPRSTLYVFFDANCLYCKLTWQALQHYEKVGLLVHWVPVAYQRGTSTGRAAAIIEARYRVAALRYNAMKYDAANYEGGIQPLEKPTAETLEKLQTNTRLMQRFGAPGTPALVWKGGDGKVRFKAGLPRLSELPAITGLPTQKIDDADLGRMR